MEKRNSIVDFNPDVYRANGFMHRDLLCDFEAGKGNDSFDTFIKEDAIEYAENGNGTSYIICNKLSNGEMEICAFFTLQATSIPFLIRVSEESEPLKEQMWGIPSIEIKMFAVDKKYQDLFFEYEGETKPIAAWVLSYIVKLIDDMNIDTIGVKAIILHSVPEAEKFYLKNGFNFLDSNMIPIHDINSDLRAMYLMLKEVNTAYIYE